MSPILDHYGKIRSIVFNLFRPTKLIENCFTRIKGTACASSQMTGEGERKESFSRFVELVVAVARRSHHRALIQLLLRTDFISNSCIVRGSGRALLSTPTGC